MKKILLAFTILMALTGCKTTQKVSDNTNQRVKIETKYGDIVIRLYDETPLHRDNFVKLVKEGYYDGTLFHRVIKNFMIQGGDPQSKGAPADKLLGGGDLGYTLPAEIRSGLYHKRGAVAAAREGDHINPERKSSACQFYIVWGQTFTEGELYDLVNRVEMQAGLNPGTMRMNEEQVKTYTTIGGAPHLDKQYTVFGEVEEGLDVLEKIQTVATGRANRPLVDIPMKVSMAPRAKKK